MNTELDEVVGQDVSDEALELAAGGALAQGGGPTFGGPTAGGWGPTCAPTCIGRFAPAAPVTLDLGV